MSKKKAEASYLEQAHNVMNIAGEAGLMPAHIHTGLMAQAQVHATMAVAEQAARIADALDAMVARSAR